MSVKFSQRILVGALFVGLLVVLLGGSALSIQQVGATLARSVEPSENSASLTLYASSDSWIDAENVAVTHGVDTDLEVGRVGGRIAFDHQILLRFDLASLPADAVITQARLQLYQHAAQDAPDGLGIWPEVISARWTEKDVTWGSKPSSFSLDDPPTYATQANGWKEWDVTQITREWAAHPTQNYGVLLRGDGATVGLRTFYAREYGEGLPRLVIDYDVPGATSTPTPTLIPTSTPTHTPTPSTCTQVHIAADADSWADQGQPTVNHGTDTSLTVGKTAQASSNRVTLAHFNVNTLPTGAWIDHAWLEFYQTGASGPAQFGVWVDALTARWGETTVTWASIPATVDVGVTPLALPAATGVWRRWDLTDVVQGWVVGDGVAAGVLLRGDGATVGARTFAARESATPPRLTLCYGLDTTPPSNPSSFTADHTVNQWSNNPWISGQWTGASDGTGSGVHGYGVAWTHSATTVPDPVISTTTHQTTQQLGDGDWYLHVRTRDVAGNWTVGAAHFGPYKIDATPPTNPTITSATHTPGAWSKNTSVTVSWAGATDGAGSGLAGYSIVWDTAAATSPDTVVDMTGTNSSATRPDGSTYFHLRTKDGVGNWSAPAHFGPIRIDTLGPTTQISAPAQVTNKTFTVSWSASDAGSGVAYYEVRYRDLTGTSQAWKTLSTATTLTSKIFTGMDGHRYTFQARGYDALGNVRDWSGVPTANTGVATVDFNAIGLEVTQGIQDMDNSVRMVAGKRTFARLHVNAASGDHGPVKAQLNLYRDGAFVQAILPSNPDGSITVRQNPDRGQLQDSFYFDLPESWLHGTVTLDGRISGTSWAQTNSNNDTASATVTFEVVPPLDVTLVDVGYILNGTLYTTPAAQVFDQASWLSRIYPVPSVNAVYGWVCCFNATLNSKGEMVYPACGDVNSDLAWHKANNAFGTAALKWSRTYGMVSDAGQFMRGCSSSIPSTIASGPTWPGSEWYGSHELGHAFNQVHTKGDSPAPCGNCSSVACGGSCGCEGGAVDHGRNGDISLTKSPYVGTTLYGFDIETLAIYPPDWKENMTYCNPEWISDYTYESIMSRIQWEGSHVVAAQVEQPGEYLAVFGSLITETQQVTLGAFYRLTNTTDLIGREPGAYSIRLLGEGGAQLADYPFTPRWSHQDPGLTCGASIATSENPARITEYVPWVEGTRRIGIFFGDQELAGRVVSGHTPMVTLLSPNGGQTLTGASVTVSWSASDGDNDPLTFSVEYSMDGGASWRLVQSGLTVSQTSLPLAKLGGTTQGEFRVLATDGVNTGQDASDGVFSVADKAPVVYITSPTDGARYIPGQPVALIAQAMDVEDGTLTGAALQWTSNVSGTLGTGKMLHVMDLPPGQHTLTLTATDQGGHAATQSVTILVAELNEQIYLPSVRK